MFRPGYQGPARRPEFRIRIMESVRRVYGPAVGQLAGEMIEGVWRKQIPSNVARLVLSKLLPDRLPADISTLPAEVRTPAQWLATVIELRNLRRDQKITDEEWLTLLEAETASFRAVQEATALMAAERG
jgi:hypothetical protein